MIVSVLALDAKFADVNANLFKCKQHIKKAAEEGSELILLPEFFTSAIGFSPEMDGVAAGGRAVRKWMQQLSADYKIIIGGSYLLYDGSQGYEIFDLVFPSGEVFSHKKDIPAHTALCYATFGDSDNVLHTPIGDIGVALGDEMIRTEVINRLAGNCDFLLTCSCWPDLPEDAPADYNPLRLYNRALAAESPVVLARLLGVSVIHASHCGKVTSLRFPENGTEETRQLIGAAQVVDSNGTVVYRHPYVIGEALVTETLPTRRGNILSYDRDGYWLPDLPEEYLTAWTQTGAAAQKYYREKMLPRYPFYL